jgi:GntR family transcriptional regulator/MocR family aminotransferase
MRIPLERGGQKALYRQIQAFIRGQIQTGNLLEDSKLPATRALAADLGVSRITVANAYAELEAEGLIYTRPGSGTFVAPQLEPPPIGEEATGAQRDWPLWQQDLLGRTWHPVLEEIDTLTRSVERPNLISFTGGMGAEELYPAQEFARTMREIFRRDSSEALGYGDPAGYPPLRVTIAHILSSQGIPTNPDEVLVTSGSMQAISLAAYLCLRPGDVVVVESPTYSMAIDLFRSLDVRVLGVPVDDQGMVVEELDLVLQTSRPRLIYTIPTFHNPTSSCMSGSRRRELIALGNRYNVPILEDDFAGDLRYEGRAQPALKALDPGGRVIYVSTFSKMLMPALRVGFLVASGPVYDRLLALKRTIDLATSNLMQRALEAYITVGRYQAHLRRACRVYRKRRNVMLEALGKEMPSEVRWSKPQGGLFIWLQLPRGFSADELFPVAGEEGVSFAPGSYFFPGRRVKSFLRLNFVMNSSEGIQEGIRRLGRAVERYMDLKRRERGRSVQGRKVPI